jgi:hypothetical protein
MSTNESSASPSTAQAIIAAPKAPDGARLCGNRVQRSTHLPHLRFVQPASPPRGRLAVRISVLDGRLPFGRSQAFRLAESDIDGLIAIIQRMERRP